MNKVDRAKIDALATALADKGLLVEAGWAGLRAYWLAPDMPEDRVRELRMAFFAGAQHVFASVFSVLEEGEEGTENDFRRLDQIDAELRRFAAEFEARHLPTQGSA